MDLTVRIFTHPSCPRCGNAVKTVWELNEKRPDLFRYRTISLTDKEGLAQAHAENIRTIPTLILSGEGAELHRIVGAPTTAQLEQTLNDIVKAGEAS